MTENEYIHERINAAIFVITRLAEVIGTYLPATCHIVEELFDEANDHIGVITREYEKAKRNAAD